MGSTERSELPHAIGKVARRELALHGFTDLQSLSAATRAELLAIHGVGPKALRILEQVLDEQGLAFASVD